MSVDKKPLLIEVKDRPNHVKDKLAEAGEHADGWAGLLIGGFRKDGSVDIFLASMTNAELSWVVANLQSYLDDKVRGA